MANDNLFRVLFTEELFNFPSAVGLLTVISVPTGASEPKNMIYMSRLGIWGEGTPFRAFDEFLHAIEKR